MTTMLAESWVLAPDVALRPEPFGALAYHFSTRRLTFLKRRELVTVVENLNTKTIVRDALETACVPSEQWPAYIKALESLASTGMIVRCAQGDVS